MSLHEWSFLDTEHAFLGLENYREMLRDDRFWNALKNQLELVERTSRPYRQPDGGVLLGLNRS